ncbi:unnamed protein product [Rotaria sp. Silwood1]|nr:unnamed protein product [Rotaria sp. Silwood1]CAF3514429.1 unnamed protein product [Rotaria sp. Silwood1]CAF4886824.1 unnamed protein product [Rotaria sp. Silwood1]CAF5008565.1 unnamed protein product [Rotaria sp. Silwood1]
MLLLPLFIILGIVLFGFIVYKIADHYAHRYLGFNSIDHNPISITESSFAPVLVCVLGWGGCKRRQLRRLLNFYSSHHIPTVSWTNPMFNCLFGIDIKQIEHLLDILFHESQTSNKIIIIHLHSNNGALVWSYMLNIMKTNEHYNQLLSNIKGIIFDSAPFVRFNNTSNWIIVSAIGTSQPCVSIILNQARYFHLYWTPLMIYYLFIRYFYLRYFSSYSYSARDKIRELLTNIPTNIKQYYLYSTADRLISSSSIEKFMAIQVERGIHVMSHRFVDSGHVNHFRLHSIEYGKFILDFISNIEKDNLSDKLN